MVMVDKMTLRKAISRLLLWSCLVLCAEDDVYWSLAKGPPSLVAPESSWLALPVVLATLIPSTTDYVGTFDYFSMQSMRLSGNDLHPA